MFEVMEKILKNRCSANTPGKIYINDLHDIKYQYNTEYWKESRSTRINFTDYWIWVDDKTEEMDFCLGSPQE